MTDIGNEFGDHDLAVPVNDSATNRISINVQKINLVTLLNDVLRERRCLEKRRNALLQSAALRQHQVHELQHQCDMAWEQKLLQAQTTGNKIESECTALRERRDVIHKRLLAVIEGNMPCRAAHVPPSIRANYKIQASFLQKDISELKRRVLHAKLRLDSEIKAIEDLSNSVKKLRVDLGAKKLNSLSIRPQALALVKHANQCRTTREAFRSSIAKRLAAASVTTPREKRFH